MDNNINVRELDERAEGITRIVTGLDIYLEKVGSAMAEYGKMGPAMTADRDPIAAYVAKMLEDAGADAPSGRAGRGGRGSRSEGLEPLSANRLIEEVVPILRRIVNRRARLKAEPADRELRIMANREKLSQVFAAIVAYGSGIIKKGGTITILARLLPLRNHVAGKGACALLSVSSDDVATGRPGITPGRADISKKSARRAFQAIRSIIAEHHGAVDLVRRPGRAQFNIYLPLLPKA